MKRIKRFSTVERSNIVDKSQQCLWSNEGTPGRDYLINQRCISEDVLRKFNIGYLPQSLNHQLAGRVIFPLYDPSGNLIVVLSRLVKKADGFPVYWHEQYDKRYYLYGIKEAKEKMRAWRFVVLCVAGDQKCIDTANGRYKKIKDCDEGDHILSFDAEKNKNVSSKILNKIYSGEKECYRVKTLSGNTLVLTEDHKVFANGEWKKTSCLNEGDCLLLPLKHNSQVKEHMGVNISEEQCRLLGYFIGDDYCCGSPEFTNIDPGIVADFSSIITKMGDGVDKRDDRHYGRASSHIQLFLKRYGLYGKRAYEKIIPSVLFSLPDSFVIQFLNGLYDTDGCISKDKTISYSTTSHDLAYQIQILLLRFGAKSTVSTIHYDNIKHRTGYLVTCTGDSSVNLAKHLSLRSNKKESRRLNILSKKQQSSSFLYPVVDYIRNLCKNKKVTKKSVLLKAEVSLTTLNRKYIGINHIKKINSVLQDYFLSLLETGNFYTSTVLSIEKSVVLPVYDLQIENTHNFYCENILVHNCEGQFDALQLHASGMTNTVALCGNKMSDVQAAMIYRYCEDIVVLLDRDKNLIGQRATVQLMYPKTEATKKWQI